MFGYIDVALFTIEDGKPLFYNSRRFKLPFGQFDANEFLVSFIRAVASIRGEVITVNNYRYDVKDKDGKLVAYMEVTQNAK